MISSTQWLPLTVEDLSEVDRIATIIHPSLPERPEIFAEKFHLFPQGCFKFVADGRIFGYGITHPWELLSIPALDDFLIACPPDADCLYMHDVAVLEEMRGNKAAERYLAILRTLAKKLELPKIACVSVYGTDALWSRFGFEVVKTDALSRQLATYGPTAKYMVASSQS